MSEKETPHFETCGDYWKWKYKKDYSEFNYFMIKHSKTGIVNPGFVEYVYDEIKKDNYRFSKALYKPVWVEGFRKYQKDWNIKGYANYLLSDFRLDEAE